jgi:hypothetical protein
MAKKDEFIRIRSDEDLKAALKEAAARSDRKEADQARYLLRIALGLIDPEEDAREVTRRVQKVGSTPSEESRAIKSGTQKKAPKAAS